MNLFSLLIGGKNEDGLEEMELDKKLKRVPQKQLGVQTYKRLDKHMRECAVTSKMTVVLLMFLAVDKLTEIFHLPHITLGALLGGG